MDIRIRAAKGGYIVNDSQERIFTSLEEVFKHLLLSFEGKGETFRDDSYGTVQILRQRPEPREAQRRGDAEIASAARRYVHTYETTRDTDEERMAVGDALWKAVKSYKP